MLQILIKSSRTARKEQIIAFFFRDVLKVEIFGPVLAAIPWLKPGVVIVFNGAV